jgi:hypothetical protein
MQIGNSTLRFPHFNDHGNERDRVVELADSVMRSAIEYQSVYTAGEQAQNSPAEGQLPL